MSDIEDYLMVGTVGVDVDAWQGGFYDEDLPEDWRMASYSSLLRSVLVPPGEMARAIGQGWADEVDDEFRFVLRVGMDDIDLLKALPAALERRTAGCVVELADASLGDELRDRIRDLNRTMPVCLDSAGEALADTDLDDLCGQLGLARVWYPSRQDAPLAQGGILVAIIDEADLPGQRRIVEMLDGWMAGSRPAGLFHALSDDAPERAQQTRLLAEMMGV